LGEKGEKVRRQEEELEVCDFIIQGKGGLAFSNNGFKILKLNLPCCR